MTATKILWGQILTVFAIVLTTTWSDAVDGMAARISGAARHAMVRTGGAVGLSAARLLLVVVFF